MGPSSETTASTVTTKTKTKTKMPSKNIIVVSGPSLAASRSRRGGTDKNYSLWGGGSTTVVSPDGSNGDVILAELECVPSVVKYKVNTENTNRPGRANKRKAEEELLDPEEDEKRRRSCSTSWRPTGAPARSRSRWSPARRRSLRYLSRSSPARSQSNLRDPRGRAPSPSHRSPSTTSRASPSTLPPTASSASTPCWRGRPG